MVPGAISSGVLPVPIRPLRIHLLGVYPTLRIIVLIIVEGSVSASVWSARIFPAKNELGWNERLELRLRYVHVCAWSWCWLLAFDRLLEALKQPNHEQASQAQTDAVSEPSLVLGQRGPLSVFCDERVTALTINRIIISNSMHLTQSNPIGAGHMAVVSVAHLYQTPDRVGIF